MHIGDQYSKDDLWIHDEKDNTKAYLLTRFFDDPAKEGRFPRPFGVLYDVDRPRYEEGVNEQVHVAVDKMGKGDLDELLHGDETWVIR